MIHKVVHFVCTKHEVEDTNLERQETANDVRSNTYKIV